MRGQYSRSILPFLIQFVTVIAILGSSLAIIAYGRGYRLDVNKSSIKPTGLVSVTSDPIGAQVFLENILKTATNNSFAVDPGWYNVTISKEGYISWQKRLRIQGEVVSRADAFLFPTNPSLSPLTTLGLQQPLLSPDGTKITYIIPADHLGNDLAKKAGLWVYELSEGPLGRNRDPIQLATIDNLFDVQNTILIWSPDSTQIISKSGLSTRLFDLNKPGDYVDISAIRDIRQKEWEDERQIKESQKLEGFEQVVIDVATSSAHILSFSPDETKILYEATAAANIPIAINPPLIGTNSITETRKIIPGNIYVYDSKEDKNFLILEAKEIPARKPTPTPTRRPGLPSLTKIPESTISPLATMIHWFPTSRHVLLTLPGKIDIMEYDRTNWVTVYAGPFEEGFIAPWSNGSRIVILTNLNPGASSLPNLYTVNLR